MSRFHPIAIILGLVSGAGQTVTNTVILNEAGEVMRTTQETVGGLASGLSAATALMIIYWAIGRRSAPKINPLINIFGV